MIFPLRIKLQKELLGTLKPEEKGIAISYIWKKLEEKSGKNIFAEGDTIGYKGSTGDQRHGLLAAVDSGKFTLIEKDGKTRILYTFTFRQLFIFTAAMALFMGLFAEKWWIAVIMFSWLCGMNWIISIIRHENFLLDIKIGINKLVFPNEKIQEDEEEKEKLKSWF